MLYYVTKAATPNTIWSFIQGSGWHNVPFLRPIPYEWLFHRRRAPRGHYVFTDFDRLTAYEVQCAAKVAETLQAADPDIKIYNHPSRALERYPLLSRLQAAGLNSFAVTRIDGAERPKEWPVFIRSEDDCKRPDTDLLHNDAEFDAALASLAAQGIPLKRRIAVGFRGEQGPDGYFRKYGAIHIAGRILPQHILRNTGWHVKHGQVKADLNARDEYDQLFGNYAAHEAHLRRVFDLAGIDFGRADYGVVNGRIEIYEINTNPTIRGSGRKKRKPGDLPRRSLIANDLIEGFRAMNTPHASGPDIRFRLPEPRFHGFPGLDWRSRLQLAGFHAESVLVDFHRTYLKRPESAKAPSPK
jgi:hypothetical protein